MDRMVNGCERSLNVVR